MNLITMAHLGEAQSVIEKFKLSRTTSDLFIGDEILLLITGEGPFEAAIKTALIIPLYPIKKIFNLGIAGSLDASFNVGEIHSIRTIYLIQDFKPAFKSFQAAKDGTDCLTSFERILDPEKAKKLKGVGSLVDREAWGVAMAAKVHGTDFMAFKIISDMAGTLDACELIKERAPEFSLALANHLLTFLNQSDKIKDEVGLIPGFYFTFTTEHRFKTLISKLAIKENQTEEAIKLALPTKQLLEKKILPKERTKLLLDELENRIDPTRSILNIKKSQWLEGFEKAGLKVQTDPLWEHSVATISFEASDTIEYDKKVSALKELSLTPFLDLMNGQFHVE